LKSIKSFKKAWIHVINVGENGSSKKITIIKTSKAGKS
jgi:hypothetical protein